MLYMDPGQVPLQHHYLDLPDWCSMNDVWATQGATLLDVDPGQVTLHYHCREALHGPWTGTFTTSLS